MLVFKMVPFIREAAAMLHQEKSNLWLSLGAFDWI